MRTFVIQIEGTATIQLDEKVIDVVDDEWRSMLYDLHTPEEIAHHIAYNLIFNRANLTMLDGWADLEDHMAQVAETDWEEDWEVKEITPN